MKTVFRALIGQLPRQNRLNLALAVKSLAFLRALGNKLFQPF